MTGGPLALIQEAVDRTRVLTQRRPPTGRTRDRVADDLGSIATGDARRFDPFPLLRALPSRPTRSRPPSPRPAAGSAATAAARRCLGVIRT
ncbi:hypothetical protein [Nonomuraea diastatica]|uniref:Uncharacterized protein n=1 Tax=Nonomuraea diastatica TaxID=1848329 RepID=A0A4R4WQ99_9ACTN|nr:hypothetical protein [Nonomuraea diastatica]TDD16800.1 hypothetical protein E1294_29900 [Nonomuraea diastatica]